MKEEIIKQAESFLRGLCSLDDEATFMDGVRFALDKYDSAQYQRGIKDAIEVCEKHTRKIELVKSPRGAIIQMFKELQSKLKGE